jgi:hypothetical protein
MNWEKLQFLITLVMFIITLVGFVAIFLMWIIA